jgi:very-short-patch-repair endonuclease
MKYVDFLTPTGRVNSMKVKEKWLKKNAPFFYQEVEQFIKLNELTVSRPVEKIWHYFNNIKEEICCKNQQCNNTTKFIGLSVGYLEYCSSKCSNGANDVKVKKENSNLKKYGVKNPYQSKEIIDKIRRTNLKRHGVENPMLSNTIKDKMKQRSLDSTGKEWALSKGGRANLKKIENLKKSFEEKYKELQILEYSDAKFGICKFHRMECGHDFTINKWQLFQRKSIGVILCTECNPISSFTETVWQTEISNFLLSHGIKFKERDRSILGNLELDFYLEEYNYAIELNGLYWHSIEFKDPNYHLNKTERCEKLGIQLIHIFEDEWVHKKEIVLSRLLNLLNKSKFKIYARKCKVKEIDGSIAKKFIDENHIQGNIPASKRLGLFYNDELVSVMTFGALRRALGSTPSDRNYEMYRFCNKLEYSIIGGASKLLNHFIKNEKPEMIISYADRRWSIGNLYKKLGFELIKKTKPNFWYTKGSTRIHRFNYTKKKIIEKYGKNKEHNLILLELGISQIYDSGNLKFILKINNKKRN